MIKTNYKPEDKIEITKPGPFHGLNGKVLSNHLDSGFKPLSCDLGPYGTWQFNYEDVKLEKEEKEVYPFDQPGKAPKATKVKASKKPAKEKRSYNRKPKTND